MFDKDKKGEVKDEAEKAAAEECVADTLGSVDLNGEASTAEDEAEGKAKGEAEGKGEAEEQAAEPDWKTLYAHTLADFDNFRKRTARDREDWVKQSAADILKDLLPTVDTLALALEKATAPAEDPFVQGVRLVYDGFVKVLADHGATPIDSLGEPFDANFHEAIAQLPSNDVEEGHVMNEVKRGWLLHGKLLRAAQVVVSSGKANG